MTPGREILALAVVAAVALGCGGLRVRTQLSPSADLSRYRTYDWSSAAFAGRGVGAREAATLDGWIRDAVDAELQAKGYEPYVAGEPDFVVDYRVGLRNTSADPYVLGNEEGRLVIGVVDARSQEIVWRGSARAAVDPRAPGTRAAEAVRRILASFPAAGGAR